jgi:hypothetical protein
MQQYRDGSPGTREFNLQPTGLVAAPIRQIAVLLFQSDTKPHNKGDNDRVVS